MKAYIVHFDDKPWEDLDDELYYRCFEIPWFSTTKTTISRLTPYTEDSAYAHGYTEAESKYREIRDELEKQAYQRGYEEAYDTAYADAEEIYESGKRVMYQKGLKDAWEAARKIIHMPEADLLNLFPECYAAVCTSVQVFLKYDASECIEKIRAYEQGKEEIKVGDEVEAVSRKAVIIEVLGNGKDVRYMYPDASIGFNDSCNVTRTGRHFPEIAAVLEKMQMKDGDNE